MNKISNFIVVSVTFFLLVGCKLVVKNGSGSGEYDAGEVVTIKANTPEEGYRFYRWLGARNVQDEFSPSTTIKISGNVEVTATYTSLSEKFNVDVINGSGTGLYFPGEVISIESKKPTDDKHKFRYWVGDTNYLANSRLEKQELRVLQKELEFEAVIGEIFSVEVKDGTGAGGYFENDIVTVNANPPKYGEACKEWVGDSYVLSEPTKSSQSFKMPIQQISLEATYQQGYNVEVKYGTGDGVYIPGKKVTIKADAGKDGVVFDEWSGDVDYLADATNSTQSLDMPSNNVSFEAQYKEGEVTSYKLEHVYSNISDPYKLVGMLGTSAGLFITTSNVYRGSYSSKIFLNGNQIYKGSQETIGQPFVHGSKVVFPVEWGSNTLYWENGMRNGGGTLGHWSVAGVSYQGRALVAFNNKYDGRTFSDYPVLQDAFTGQKIATLKGKSMPRKFVEYNGDLWISQNFGENLLVSLSGHRIASPALHVEVYNGTLYGGGGMDWGSSMSPNGKIYKWTGSSWVEIFDTGSTSVQHMAVLDGRLWIACPDPDRLFAMNSDGTIHMVAEITGESSGHRARDFGAAVAFYDGHIYWGRSDNSRPYVYKLVPDNN